MKEVKVEISGDALLMHSPRTMLIASTNKTRNMLEQRDPIKEADEGAYKMESGELYVPSDAIFGCILKGAAWKKSGKHSLAPILAAGIRIKPIEIGLGTKKFIPDIRTVVIKNGMKKSRIVRGRARVDNWKLKFNILYNEELIPNPGIIRECLKDAGERVGILDFRPECRGPFGTFKVELFKVIE